jgi:hypothetical protein
MFAYTTTFSSAMNQRLQQERKSGKLITDLIKKHHHVGFPEHDVQALPSTT